MNRPIAIDALIERIETSRTRHHPFFRNLAQVKQSPQVLGALFDQIQRFCAATRPSHNFPASLRAHGFPKQARLIETIVSSETDHGLLLAAMAGCIINRAAGGIVFPDLADQSAVENGLRGYGEAIFGGTSGYSAETGLLAETHAAIAVFERRRAIDYATTLRSLGTALALEIISNRHLIPGEIQAFIASGHYGVGLDDPEITYLRIHAGSGGAEDQHERHVIDAVTGVLDVEPAARRAEELITEGVDDFLLVLASLWDTLDGYIVMRTTPASVLVFDGCIL